MIIAATTSTIPELVGMLVWPAVVVVALILFRRPLGALIGKILNLKVEAAGVTIETKMREYVSPQVLEQLARDPSQLRLAAEQRRVVILHAEVRGFTGLAETMAPELLASLIQDYLTRMTDAVFAQGGTLDRYEGMALTAYWGAPIDYADSAPRACRAALDMVRRLQELNPELQSRGLAPLTQSICITTATVVVGNLGSAQRFRYSILGDYIDVLPRLAYLAGQLRKDVIVTEYTYDEIADQFATNLLQADVQVRGKTKPVTVYALEGEKPPAPAGSATRSGPGPAPPDERH
jgi:adenylate cyclase